MRYQQKLFNFFRASQIEGKAPRIVNRFLIGIVCRINLKPSLTYVAEVFIGKATRTAVVLIERKFCDIETSAAVTARRNESLNKIHLSVCPSYLIIFVERSPRGLPRIIIVNRVGCFGASFA